MAKQIIGVIPARLGSKRFPSKVLYPYKDKPLLFYVYKEIMRSKLINRLIIATDNKLIAKAAENFGAEVVITSSRHQTGSDRVGEVLKKVGGDIIINIQGDNFGLKASVLDRLITKFKKDKYDYGTMAYRITDDKDLTDSNSVNVVTNKKSEALWFSRYPIPYLQGGGKRNVHKQFSYFGHIGVYLYTKRGLNQYCRWKRCDLEKAESLEQLRILENNQKMKVYLTKNRPVSVDVKEDLKKLKELYK